MKFHPFVRICLSVQLSGPCLLCLKFNPIPHKWGGHGNIDYRTSILYSLHRLLCSAGRDLLHIYIRLDLKSVYRLPVMRNVGFVTYTDLNLSYLQRQIIKHRNKWVISKLSNDNKIPKQFSLFDNVKQDDYCARKLRQESNPELWTRGKYALLHILTRWVCETQMPRRQ